jgi:hypothetical protein
LPYTKLNIGEVGAIGHTGATGSTRLGFTFKGLYGSTVSYKINDAIIAIKMK